MSMNEADTRYHLIDPVLRDKGYVSRDHITLEADEAHAGQPFPSCARQLARRGTPVADSRWSWTVDFAARRAKAREEMLPLRDEAARLKAEVADIKEELKRLKKVKAGADVLEAHEAQIREKDKAARYLEAQAAAIDAAVFDLKAVNPNAVATVDQRTPAEIIASIDAQGRIVAQALKRLSALLKTEAPIEQDGWGALAYGDASS
ncbi:MAG TPA: hypothetical protein VEX87_18310 [Skermanella sp.]|jgi:type I restriction enzyme M protein|nr:hypothetical protein [Skermanella sp.]